MWIKFVLELLYSVHILAIDILFPGGRDCDRICFLFVGHFLGYFYISELAPVWVSWSDVCEWRAENYLLSLPGPVTPTPTLRQTNNSKANLAKHSLWIRMEIVENCPLLAVQKFSNYGKTEA